MLSLFIDILDELDDILISSILLAVVFSFSIDGFSIQKLYTLFILMLIYIVSKVIFLKIFSRVVYGDHVEFKAFDSERLGIIKEGIEDIKAAIVFRIFDLIRRFSPAFSAFLSFISMGLIKIPFYGKIHIEPSFPEVKEKKITLKEKSDISAVSILFDFFFALILLLMGTGLQSMFLLIAASSLIPMISSEGTNIIVFNKNLWLYFINVTIANTFLSLYNPKSLYPILGFSILLSVIVLKFQKA